MNKDFNDYIDIIISSIGVKGKKANKIREDLYNSLTEKQQATGESNPYFLMGEPKEIAVEFRENLGIKYEETNCCRYWLGYGCNYEYISKVKLFGLPLIHVNAKPMGVAKGIIACGSIAIGFLSLGVVSVGVLSIGALCAGLLAALGGAAVSLFISLGGAAISGYFAAGGLAIAKNIALGGYASANIAIGGVTKGVISIFNQHGTGEYRFMTPVNPEAVMSTIKSVYPNLGELWLNIIRAVL